MSNPTPEILPYATLEGIRHYVPLEAYDDLRKDRDRLEQSLKHTGSRLTEYQQEVKDLTKRVQAAEHTLEGYRALEAECERLQRENAQITQERDAARIDKLAAETREVQNQRLADQQASRDRIAANELRAERDLSRERNLEMADVLQRTEDERRQLIAERDTTQSQLDKFVAAYHQSEREKSNLEDERDELQKDVSALLRALDAHDVAEGVNTAMHLREAVAELNERMTTEVKSYMTSMEALRAENRRLEKELSATRGQA